ncbi:PREDICTED: ATG8-interacting protein 2 isoform X2 [Tarenaya hassleriana]|nr:PREDICTED: ATG8-interacting protein 2 isoform X2 [Tarenaya hassleriana]XP_010556551.1 PREDICTED: ATG8-interacting protein 2 isoform X2 [Tarenaya hassleriana]
MSDKEEGEENTTRGNDWEVVSLSASAYATSPGPKEGELKDDDKGVAHYEAETSHPLFMSRHFVFPPSEHENLPLERIEPEIHEDKVSKNIDFGFRLNEEEEAMTQGKEEGDLTLKGLNLTDEFAGHEFLDEKGKREESIYNATLISSLNDERSIVGSNVYEEKEPVNKDEKHEEANVPCEAWWRRSAASMYAQAKEANAFWSIFIAAAVMGLVILRQQWQQERWQVLQLKWQSSIGNERAGRLTGPISRLKEVLVGGQRRGSFIRTSSSNHN